MNLFRDATGYHGLGPLVLRRWVSPGLPKYDSDIPIFNWSKKTKSQMNLFRDATGYLMMYRPYSFASLDHSRFAKVWFGYSDIQLIKENKKPGEPLPRCNWLPNHV